MENPITATNSSQQNGHRPPINKRNRNLAAPSIHDSQIDITQPGEVNYRDRGYFGAPCKGYNATIRPRNTQSSTKYQTKKCRNQRITHKRAPGEQTIRRNQKYIQLRPRQKVTTTLRNTHEKHLHLLLLQPPTTKHHQTKKHNLANANKKTSKIDQKKDKKRRN